MAETLTLPRLGETMESGRVVGWLKRPGERFRRGETIVEIETDKTVVELPALADGTLREVLAEDGTDIAVGEPLCRYDATDGGSPAPDAGAEATNAIAATADVEAPVPAAPMGAEPEIARSDAAAPEITAPAAMAPVTERRRATPLARVLARQQGIALTGLHGSGRRGRVEARDVLAATGGSRSADEALFVRHWEPVGGTARATALLLHGFGGDGQTWAALAAHLTWHGLAVAAPDLPGHGATRLDASDTAGLAAPLEHLLRDAPVELVGHSMGGAAAVALARACPERVARLTLIAPLGLDEAIDADFVRGLAAVGSPGGLAHLLRRLSSRPAALSPEALATMAQTLAAGRLNALADALLDGARQRLDLVPDLAALPMPVRVVWGLEDRIVPWTQVVRLPSRVAVHLIAGAGHMPQWDAPQEVAALFA